MSNLDPFSPLPRSDDLDHERVPRPQGNAAFGWAGVVLILLIALIAVLSV